MDKDRISQVMRTTRLKLLRCRLLSLLSDSYPKHEHSDVLYWRLTHEANEGTCINEVVNELHYLAEKGLLQLEQVVEERYLATITARGRDYLGGTIQVEGLWETPASAATTSKRKH